MITYIFVTNQLRIKMRRDVFQAIADPIRRDIIGLLAQEAMTVNAIAEQFEISRPAISKHLKILDECGLLQITQSGRERHCQINPYQLMTVADWLEQYRQLWEQKLDSFEEYLDILKTKNNKDDQNK
ncbi:ArsR/SmtB family transcription factor [Spongiimicrobium sp. 3-5]|uniref:ArsR/SmtB family transcription factor n=1 Tax=Spongiimicrobium sp. 3-5 TaxID=3332596 RepID=UPI003980B077